MWFLTNQCNLNCLNCANHCDDPSVKKFFIPLDDVELNLKKIKILFPNLNFLDLSGGEAILHPQIQDICKMIYKFFPNIKIMIYTNGLILNHLTEDLLSFLANYHIKFVISIYPRIKYFQQYELLFNKLNNNNIEYEIRNSLLFHCNPIIQDLNSEEKKKCFCTNYDNSAYYLINNYFYPCCVAINNFSYLSDYSRKNLATIQNLSELNNMMNNSLTLCYNCQNTRVFIHPWHETTLELNRSLLKKYNYNLFDLYYYDYDKYKQIYYDYDKDYLILMHYPIMRKSFGDMPGLFNKLSLSIKYLNGLLDIYIYIPNNLSFNTLNDYINQIQKQSIFPKCNFYYLKNSNDNNYNTMNKLYNRFSPYEQEENHCYYLQSNSYENGYQQFLNHSFLPYKFSLDITNLNNLKDENYLKKQYNQLQGI